MRTIGQRELRNDNAEIMREVEAGETFVVTRNGTPVAELRPVRQRRRWVPRDQLLEMARKWEPGDAAGLRRDLDAAVDPWVDL